VTNERMPRLIRPTEVTDETAQTTNLHRFVAIDPQLMGMSGSSRLYFGRAVAPPHTRSSPHHHGEAETGGYVLRGRCRVYWGENFSEYFDAEPGDFMYVPPHVPHIEANEHDEEYEGILVRSPDNIVVNLEEDGGDGSG
jgi:uncharacterized RmlC-like cupin family protein